MLNFRGGVNRIACLRRSFSIYQSTPPTVFSGGISKREKFSVDNDTSTLRKLTESSTSPAASDPIRSLKEKITSSTVLVFFPRDYPLSVTPNYGQFVKYHFLGSICGTINSVLGTQALLSALGMGTGSIALSATLNWIIKDGLGLLGGVVYTSLFSGRFDSEPKRYRFQASLAFQAATLSEIMLPLVPGMFLLLASVSNIAKNISWLAMSGCRAQMHQSLCRKDSLGDLTAKAGSQSTAAGLIGTGLGVFVTAAVNGSVVSTLAAFAPLTAISLYCIYRSNAVVVTRSFNIQRTEILIHHFLKTNGEILSPEQVADQETFIRSYSSPFGSPVIVNPPLGKLKNETDALMTASQQYSSKNFILIKPSSEKTYMLLKEKATGKDILEAMFQSCKLRQSSTYDSHKWSNEFNVFYSKLETNTWNTGDIIIGEQNRISINDK